MRDEITTCMQVSLDRLIDNFHEVKNHVAPAEVYAVVKSEAYGHGAVPVAKTLQQNGCDCFAVATVDEGMQLRAAGIEGNILVMGATLPRQYRKMAECDLTPVLPDADRVRDWADLASDFSRRLPYHMKVDVGLGRMGVLPDEGETMAEVARSVENDAELVGIGSHLSHPSGEEQHNRNEFERFRKFCEPFEKHFPNINKHLAASQAAARFEYMHLDMLRIGGLLYGFEHVKSSALQLAPVMSFQTTVAQTKTLPEGWWIGYNQQYRVTEPTRIAVLPMGWTDGLSSFHLESTSLLVRGKRCPLVGVCTDFSMLDISGIPSVEAGDEVTLIGRQGDERISAIQLGKSGGMSTGQLLGKMTLRVPRLYFDDDEFVGELSILNP